MLNWLTRWREQRLLNDLDETVVERWQTRIDRLPILQGLTDGEQQRLIEVGWIFLHQKRFTPVGEAVLTSEHCIDIALQAALPVLHLSLEHYGHFHELLIYPEDFVSPRHYVDEDGLAHEGEEALSGEAWEQGPLLLSLAELGQSGDWNGFNLVIHELAHKLDIANGGQATGYPDLPPALRPAWLEAFPAAFHRHCQQAEQAEQTNDWSAVWLDPYGCENEPEFFAVCVEAFFTDPISLDQGFPRLYRLLKAFFGQDPQTRAPLWSPITPNSQ
ncbi:zinc-dependent peptidase [Ferrimonas balearica]|uniref:M90 family metallopeptidase n=1 Tax=Ferrimonas balearica TaxID=44012 RepID=UPI001C99379C|nr:M90 family metallopeptidase [Ferrimonas balearica]MBY5920508.1 zinc-dependent peptidase [Ferrimonas balearica]MBY5996807.1 zinc-dependent peptidase [Ferrimonas balearica]